jgi:hypothetical protein
MSRRLIVLNAALTLVALVAAGYVLRELRTPAPTPSIARRPPSTAVTPSAASPAAASDVPAGSYSIVAARNLFSPTRSEAPVSPAGALANVPKPFLYGILLNDANPVAYLEDPTTKRVAGYRLGDSVAGGTLKQIAADYVVLNRPDGDINVRLRDTSKPRPAAMLPGRPGAIAPTVPAGVPPPVTPALPQPGQVLAPPPGLPVLPRRPLPQNLIRRTPPAGTDAPRQD